MLFETEDVAKAVLAMVTKVPAGFTPEIRPYTNYWFVALVSERTVIHVGATGTEQRRPTFFALKRDPADFVGPCPSCYCMAGAPAWSEDAASALHELQVRRRAKLMRKIKQYNAEVDAWMAIKLDMTQSQE